MREWRKPGSGLNVDTAMSFARPERSCLVSAIPASTQIHIKHLMAKAAAVQHVCSEWERRGDLADRERVGVLDGADGLEFGRVGAVEGMAAGGELVEDEAEGEDVGLDAGLAGDELLGRHVGDGAAAGGVGGAGDSLGRADFALVDGAAGVELGLVGTEAAGEAEVEDLDEAAVGEHDVGGLEVAVEDAEGVGGGEAVGGLDAGREDELEGGGAFGDELVEDLAGDVLHDDVGFFAVAAFGWGFADVVDGADVGVVDGGGEAGFAELGGAHLLGGEVAALEEFEDDGALKEGVVGKVDDSAAAGADLADELVLLDLASLHEFIIASAGVWMMKGRRKCDESRG